MHNKKPRKFFLKKRNRLLSAAVFPWFYCPKARLAHGIRRVRQGVAAVVRCRGVSCTVVCRHLDPVDVCRKEGCIVTISCATASPHRSWWNRCAASRSKCCCGQNSVWNRCGSSVPSVVRDASPSAPMSVCRDPDRRRSRNSCLRSSRKSRCVLHSR